MKSIDLRVLHKEGGQKQWECIYQGTALLETSKCLIYQDDESVTKVLWDQEKRQMTILRQSEMKTLLVLNQNEFGTVLVANELGEMRLTNKSRLIQIGNDRWIAEYDVINGNEKMNNRFMWMIKEKKHE